MRTEIKKFSVNITKGVNDSALIFTADPFTVGSTPSIIISNAEGDVPDDVIDSIQN
jgi:hypothetical protein